MSHIYQVSFEKDTMTSQHLRDAKQSDDWPSDDLRHVTIDTDKLTANGTAKGMRWLYDRLTDLCRAWRAEGEQWDADVAEDMAHTVWETVDEMPDRQRQAKLRDGRYSA
jgi:hypothetical protein